MLMKGAKIFRLSFQSQEDFLGFIPIYDQSARSLAKVILDRCKALSLDMPKRVGQGYDGASVMGGHLVEYNFA